MGGRLRLASVGGWLAAMVRFLGFVCARETLGTHSAEQPFEPARQRSTALRWLSAKEVLPEAEQHPGAGDGERRTPRGARFLHSLFARETLAREEAPRSPSSSAGRTFLRTLAATDLLPEDEPDRAASGPREGVWRFLLAPESLGSDERGFGEERHTSSFARRLVERERLERDEPAAHAGSRRGISGRLWTWERLGQDAPRDRTASGSFVRQLLTREPLDRHPESVEPPRRPRFLMHLIARESLDEELRAAAAEPAGDSRSDPHGEA